VKGAYVYTFFLISRLLCE